MDPQGKYEGRVLNKVAEVDRNMSEENARVGENWKWFRKIGKREAYLIPLLYKHDQID